MLALSGSAAWADPQLELRTNLIWERADAWFGGFSGAEVTRGGTQITLITDRSTLITAKMLRIGGALTGLRVLQRVSLRDPENRILTNGASDAEGLAIGADGRTYISFEGPARIERLIPRSRTTQSLPTHPDFALFDLNKGPEALALHPDGTLYTLPERAFSKSFPLYALRGKTWRITHTLPKRGRFRAVGADFGPDGYLYILERAVSPLGFRSRIRRFDLTRENPTGTTLLTSGPGRFDNLEAISVWRDTAGTTRLTLISDDNFLPIQRTQIVEYTLTEVLARASRHP